MTPDFAGTGVTAVLETVERGEDVVVRRVLRQKRAKELEAGVDRAEVEDVAHVELLLGVRRTQAPGRFAVALPDGIEPAATGAETDALTFHRRVKVRHRKRAPIRTRRRSRRRCRDFG